MNEELLAALASWLGDEQLDYALNMFESGQDEEHVWDYINRVLTKSEKAEILDRLESRFPEINDNIDSSVRYLNSYPPSIQRDMEYTEYIDQLDPTEQEWIKQVYHEMYANGGYDIKEEDRILKTAEMFKEATRITNSRNRDAFSFCEKTNGLQYLEDQLRTGEIDENELTWQDLFTLRGYESAMHKIKEDVEVEINNKYIDNWIAVVRAHLKLEALRRMNARDIRTRKELSK